MNLLAGSVKINADILHSFLRKITVAGCACFLFHFSDAQIISTDTTKRSDTAKYSILNEVVISASRIRESILQSPVSIQKAGQKYFQSSPAPTFFDALENIQGVQMITPSLGFKVINARGFANTTNVRFAQLVDGMDMQSPHIGGPIGNALGPTDLDIDNVEIIPGVASALYGMNTINGMASITTKNPYNAEGLTIQQKVGINHLGDSNSSARLFSETSFRFAKVVSSKFAFKISGGYTTGYDWIADDHTDLNPKANISTNLTGYDNPAQDPANGYGNESSDRKTISLQGKSYVVARTGYYEKEVVDYSLQNIKADAGLYYKISPTVPSCTWVISPCWIMYTSGPTGSGFRIILYSSMVFSFSPGPYRLNCILIMKTPASLITFVRWLKI